MTKERLQKLREKKLKIEKEIANVKRQEMTRQRKARTHALIVIAAAIYTESVIGELKIDLSGYAEDLKTKTGRERIEYLQSGVTRALECQLKTATAKTAEAKKED